MRKHLFIPLCMLGAMFASACETPPSSATPPSGEAPPSTTEAPPPDETRTVLATALTVSDCRVLPTARVTARGHDGNPPENTQDDDLGTRWSELGPGAWLLLDVGSLQPMAGATIAWHRGNERQNHFVLETSENGNTFTRAHAGTSALALGAQTYRLDSVRQARYLRITVNGNTVNDWASIAEARVCGDGAAPAPPRPPASTTDSGPALPRQPYLQSVGQTSALVAFRSGVSCSPFVRFGEGSDLSRSASATAAGWRHAVRLEGLQPGRTYSYVVEACGSTTGVRQFRTATGPGTTRVHFTALGDFGTGGSRQRQVLETLSQPARRGELILALGDNAYSDGTEAEFQDHLFTPMAALLREVPLFPSMGNHEYITNQGQPYLDNFYLPTNNPQRTERYYSFDWAHVHFVALDSNCAIGLASADRCTLADQKRWLEQDLSATRQPWKVVFFHHPPWSSGSHGSQLKMRREFAPLFEKYGVDLVLTGHDHNYERSRPMRGDGVAPSGTRGVVYLVVGSGGASLRDFPGSQPSWSAFRDNKNQGHLDVLVDGGTLSARFIIPGGAVRDTLTLTKTLPAAEPLVPGVSAMSLETAPGPVDDPARPPEALLPRAPLPPADSLEAVAD
jgi:acid phosphatase type 7